MYFDIVYSPNVSKLVLGLRVCFLSPSLSGGLAGTGPLRGLSSCLRRDGDNPSLSKGKTLGGKSSSTLDFSLHPSPPPPLVSKNSEI